MNKSILSLITLSYLVTGCGGGNSSGNSSSSQTTIETITEAKEAYNSFDMSPSRNSLSLGQIQKSSPQHSNSTIKKLQELIGDDLFPSLSNVLSSKQLKKSQTNQKITTKDCRYGGSISTDESEDSRTSKSILLTFNSCKNTRTSVIDGTITMAENQDNNSIKLRIDATNKDGDRTVSFNSTWFLETIENPPEIRFTIDGSIKTKNGSSEFSNLIYNKMKMFSGKDDSSPWQTINGGISIENNCFTKHYTFTTPQKLRYGSSYENNTKSGILKINNSTYTFESPYVSIKTALDEETILQSELKNKNTPIECK